MSDSILLHGYAVCFDQTAFLAQSGTYEQVDRGAFDAMLARPSAHVEIRWRDHEGDAPRLASTRDGTAGLFVDDYGLGFWCRIEADRTNWGRVGSITTRQSPCDQCSIGGLLILDQKSDQYLGANRNTITQASIDHIALCASATYRNTGVWPAHHDLELAPIRIRGLASRWGQGRRTITAKSTAQTQLATLMAARQREYVAVRERFFNMVRNTNEGIIFGHAALSRAGGFKG